MQSKKIDFSKWSEGGLDDRGGGKPGRPRYYVCQVF
jgi:hypothetical protein